MSKPFPRNAKTKCRCCNKYFKFYAEHNTSPKFPWFSNSFGVYKNENGGVVGFYGHLTEKTDWSEIMRKPYLAISYPYIYQLQTREKIEIGNWNFEYLEKLADEYKIDKLWFIDAPKEFGINTYCRECFINSGSLQYAIMDMRIYSICSYTKRQIRAASKIKRWFKKCYWSPDTRIGKMRFYRYLLRDGLIEKDEVPKEYLHPEFHSSSGSSPSSSKDGGTT